MKEIIMFNNIKVKFIATKLKVDGSRMDNLIVEDINNNDYLTASSFNTFKLMDNCINESYPDGEDISCNPEIHFEFIKPVLFNDINISFEAAVYTSISIVFTNGDTLVLNGEDGDYENYEYSFQDFKNEPKYSNKLIKRIECVSNFGSEEFMELTITL